MKYYIVMLSGEYTKKKGKFGIVEPSRAVNRFLLKDGLGYPTNEYKDLKLNWANQESYKVLADYQITLNFGRVISAKMKMILEKHSNSNVCFYPINILTKNST